MKRTVTPEQIVARLDKLKLRTCAYLNHCKICDLAIFAGQMYRDGGYGNRAHVECVEKLRQKLTSKEKTQ